MTARPNNSMILNKVCELEDWENPVLCAAMRRMCPHFLGMFADYPKGRAHRKHWECAQLYAGLEQLQALRSDAVALSVGAGHEFPLYELTNHVRWVFATDIYGMGDFTNSTEADLMMLRDPDRFAIGPYNRNRLVVQYMDARDLRFEEGTFDFVFSLSSMEHFGGLDGIRTALLEMQRVMKPGGILMLTTECIVNGAPHLSSGNLELFAPEVLRDLLQSIPGLNFVEEPRLTVSPATLRKVIPLHKAVKDNLAGYEEYPHIVLELEGRQFTSVSLFLRKTA